MMPKTSTPTLGAAGFSGMPSPTGAAACYIHLELQLDVGDAQEPAVERSPGSPRLFFSSYSLLFFAVSVASSWHCSQARTAPLETQARVNFLNLELYLSCATAL